MSGRLASMARFDEAEQPQVIVAECEWCGGEIYEGDEAARIDDGGGFVHNGKCAEEYAAERVYDWIGIINDKLTGE